MYKYIEDIEQIANELTKEFNITSQSFYLPRIYNFFNNYIAESENSQRPLNAITYYDIETYLHSIEHGDAEKLNCYSALKRFFEYTYSTNRSQEVINNVSKPIYVRKPKEFVSDEEYETLKNFIFDVNKEMSKRLYLGLFLFTGLSRKYIAALRNNSFIYIDGGYNLSIWQESEEDNMQEQLILPIKSELQLLIHEYLRDIDNRTMALEKVIKLNEQYISKYISKLTESIIGRALTPTILSNTFIQYALRDGNYIWEISKLTLESTKTIEEHLFSDEGLYNRQKSILNSF